MTTVALWNKKEHKEEKEEEGKEEEKEEDEGGKINFEMLAWCFQEIMGYLNTIKRYTGRVFMKLERDKGSFKIPFCICSIRVFNKF